MHVYAYMYNAKETIFSLGPFALTRTALPKKFDISPTIIHTTRACNENRGLGDEIAMTDSALIYVFNLVLQLVFHFSINYHPTQK